jgi:hypothetical protein
MMVYLVRNKYVPPLAGMISICLTNLMPGCWTAYLGDIDSYELNYQEW